MHLVIPFAAALSEPAAQAASALTPPRLERLLGRLGPVGATPPEGQAPADPDRADEFSLSPPHEQVLATLRGWPLDDGRLPLAALWAAADGLPPAPAGQAWGLLTPSHWHVGTEQISLIDPAQLALEAEESRALAEAVRPLFEELGWAFHWGAPGRWYVHHASLSDTPTASLDRVVGRNVDLWLVSHPGLRLVRRLQSEVQMLLHTHPVNAAREARGLRPVNSFWLSGTGPAALAQAAAPLPADVVVDTRLRGPALAEDWAAWLEAWQALDAGPIAALAERMAQPGGAACRLTLCGERRALTLAPQARPWWRALFARPTPLLPLLTSL